MSSKNHTKNELARITAKIQQLKKKYPVSPELYMSQESKGQVFGDNALQEINVFGNNESHFNQRILRPKSISHTSKTNSKHDSIENILNASNSEQFSYRNDQNQNPLYTNKKQPDSKKIYQTPQSNPSSVNSSQSFEINFMKQKPFKQYKEELRHLKKQILSGLDISNFSFKKLNQIQNPLAIQEQQLNFNKTHQIVEKNQPITENKQNYIQFNQPKLSEVQEYKNKLLQSKNKKEIKNIVSIESSEFSEMKEQIKQLALNLKNQKNQFEERLSKIEFQSNSLNGQNQEIRNQIENIEQKLQESSEGIKLSQYDLKVVEIQNQSISKLSKDIHKEIQSINIELKNIKETLYSSVKCDFEIEKHQIQQTIMELLQLRMKEHKEFEQQRIKQVQSRFFREIFDLKNDIELLNEKLKKQDYIQRTIKQLIPAKGKSIEQEMPEILQRIKSKLSQDTGFLSILFKFVDSNLPKSSLQKSVDQIDRRLLTFQGLTQEKISLSYKNAKEQIGTFVYNQLGYFSTYLKQLETKMTSYGILIQHLEESLKDVSLQVKCETQSYQKHQIKKKQQISTQTQHCPTLSLTSIENHEVDIHKSEYAKSELDQSKFSHITLPFCLIEDLKKPQDQFFITKMGESKLSESKNYQKAFLLEDLVKNSLVFNAMSN